MRSASSAARKGITLAAFLPPSGQRSGSALAAVQVKSFHFVSRFLC